MDVEYEDEALKALATTPSDGTYDQAIVKAFRMRIQLICAALDERAFYAMKSLHFEKLKGDRVGQYSMRLNSQWRLILKFRVDEDAKRVVVISIADYH